MATSDWRADRRFYSFEERLKYALVPPRLYLSNLAWRRLRKGEKELRLLNSLVEPSRVTIILPDGLPEGDCDVVLVDEAYCEPVLDDAFVSEADLTIEVDAVELPFAYTGDFTPVSIYAVDPPSTDRVNELF